jgi:hypothetical protein
MGVFSGVMSNVFENRNAVLRTVAVGLVMLVGAPLACRKNGPQGGSWGAADVKSDAGVTDAGDAQPDAQADAQVDGAAALVDGGKPCSLGGATQTAGTQIMMFREAGDFAALLASADAGANQQQRTEQFRNAGGILVPFGAHCAVLDTMSSVVKVQITDGAWVGTQGWVPTDSVAVQ